MPPSPVQALAELLKGRDDYDSMGARLAKYRAGDVSLPLDASRAAMLERVGSPAVQEVLADVPGRMLLPADIGAERVREASIVPYLDRELAKDRRVFLDFVADLEARGPSGHANH